MTNIALPTKPVTMLVPAHVYVSKWLQSFGEIPPRIKATTLQLSPTRLRYFLCAKARRLGLSEGINDDA